MAKQYDQLPEVTRPLTPEQLSLMFGTLIRSDSSFAVVNSLIEDELFTDPEFYLLLAWRAYAIAREALKRSPARELVMVQIRAEATNNPDLIPPVVSERAQRLIDAAYSLPLDDANSPTLAVWAKEEFKKFYEDRIAVRRLQKKLAQTAGFRLIDPRKIIQETQLDLNKANALTAAEIFRITDAINIESVTPTPTGVDIWDRATGGGLEPEKIYGLFGPTGSFKTGLAVQLMCGTAKSDYVRKMFDPSYQRGQIIYFAYECSREEILMRALSCAAEIPYERMKEIIYRRVVPNVAPRSEPYEDLIDVELRDRSERQRIDFAVEVLSGVSIQGMGASNDDVHGRGYVPELAGCVENVRRQTGAPILGVYVDYAKLMARRYCWSNNIHQDRYRGILSQLPDLLRAEVGERYKTPVVLLQQLDNEANKAKAGRLMHHSFSSEAKDLGENMWYCLCLSKIDIHREHITVLNPSKTRGLAGIEPEVLRLDGNRSKLVPCSSYRVNTSGEILGSEQRDASPLGVDIVGDFHNMQSELRV